MTKPRKRLLRRGFSAALARALCFLSIPAAIAAPRLDIQHDAEPRLEWDSMSNIHYDVEVATSLTANTWCPVESVLGSGATTTWNDPTRSAPRRYYRLRIPAARITGFEPAYASTNGGGTAYLVGRNMDTDTRLRIDGVDVGGTLVLSAGHMRVTLPPLAPGPHVVQLIDNGSGAVLDTWSNAFTVAAGIEERLMPPPEPPPARPIGPVRWMAPEALNRSVSSDVGPITWMAPEMVRARSPGANAGMASTPGRPVPSQAMIANTSQLPPVSATDVHFFSGELCVRADDLRIPGVGFDFVWCRTYRSRTGEETPLGFGWDHSYNVSLEPADPNTNAVVLRCGLGRRDTFYRRADGFFTRDGFFVRIGDLDRDGRLDLAFADAGRWVFHPLDGTPRAGRLLYSIDRNSNTMSFVYDNLGRLTNIVDTLDRPIALDYDVNGRLVSVTDFSGRSVRYAYYGGGEAGGSPGDLKSATTPAVTNSPATNDFPAGKTTTYTYSTAASTGETEDRLHHNLLSITDARGQQWLTVTYAATNDPTHLDFDSAMTLQRGIHRTDIHRVPLTPSPSNGYATVRAIVNDWSGSVREYEYDSRHRVVGRRDFTAPADPGAATTAGENRPGAALRPSDPLFYETRCVWNRDSLLSEYRLPAGNTEEFIYEDDLSPGTPRTRAGNLRLRRRLPGPRGADQQAITELYTHHASFGSDPTRALGAGGVALSGPLRVGDLDRDGALDLATTVTDSRKHLTICRYDARGNRISIDPPESSGRHDFEYDDRGRPVAHVHPADVNGRRRRDTFTYHANGPQRGYLHTVTRDAGTGGLGTGLRTTTIFEYDSAGNMTRRTGPRGFDEQWVYNERNQVVRYLTPPTTCPTCPGGEGPRAMTEYLYDANDNLVETRIENRDDRGDPGSPPSIRTVYAYDLLDSITQRVVTVTVDDAITNRFEYDGNRALVRAWSAEAVAGHAPSNVVRYTYDGNRRLFTRSRAAGTAAQTTDRFAYDPNGNLVEAAEDEERPDGPSVTRYEYDGFDRPVRRVDPMSNTVSCTYDANGNVVRELWQGELNDAEPGGGGNTPLAETRYDYDALDRCVRRVASFFDPATGTPIDDGEVETRVEYAPGGGDVVLWIEDDLRRVTHFDYDALWRLVRIEDPASNVVACAYDAGGNATNITRTDRSSINGPAQTTQDVNGYDSFGRRIISSSLYACSTGGTVCANTNRFAYDSRGNLVGRTDARGNETRYVYDGWRRRVRIDDYAGTAASGTVINTTRYEYDANSRCVAITDGNSNTTRFAYDSLDRLVEREDADGVAHTFTWDSARDLGTRVDGNSNHIVQAYDRLHRLQRRTVTPGGGGASNTTIVTVTYDGLSRPVEVGNDAPTLRFSYDSMGNTVSEMIGARATTYTYDGIGNRLSVVTPGGSVVAYAYDAAHRLTNIVFAPTNGTPIHVESVAHLGPGRVSHRLRGNGVDTTITYGGGLGGITNAPGDANVRQPAHVRHADDSVPIIIDDRAITYDADQNRISRRLSATGTPTGTVVYSYDAMWRLTHATATTSGIQVLDTTYAYDAVGNRVTVAGGPGAGQYTRDPTLPEPADFQVDQYTTTPHDTRQYDQNGNTVVRVTPSDQLHYRYDYANRLVAVSNATRRTHVVSYEYDALGRRVAREDGTSGVRHEYAYDGRHVVEEFTNGVSTRVHVSGGASTDDDSVGTFTWTLLGGPFWHHLDDENSVVALSDTNGAVVERYAYDAFGRTSIRSPDGEPRVQSIVGNPYMYRGMRWDPATELYTAEPTGPAWGGTFLSRDIGLHACSPYDPLVGRTLTRNNEKDCAEKTDKSKAARARRRGSVAGGGGGPEFHECFPMPRTSGHGNLGEFHGIHGMTYLAGTSGSGGGGHECFPTTWLAAAPGAGIGMPGVGHPRFASGRAPGGPDLLDCFPTRWDPGEYSPSSSRGADDPKMKVRFVRGWPRAVTGRSAGGGIDVFDCFPTRWDPGEYSPSSNARHGHRRAHTLSHMLRARHDAAMNSVRNVK